MRLSLDWLAELVDLPPEDELVDGLNVGGFEDVRVETPGPDLSAIRVGHVLERAPHPNADRLSVCRVDVGEGEPLEIVCGAPNVAAGQKVAVARVGTTLPDGRTLERAKLRGVASNGMILSARELGLSDEHAGILVLGADARVGAPLSEALGGGGRVLEVGITPNRGDAASVLGMAREVRALFGGALRLPETTPPERGPAARSRDPRGDRRAGGLSSLRCARGAGGAQRRVAGVAAAQARSVGPAQPGRRRRRHEPRAARARPAAARLRPAPSARRGSARSPARAPARSSRRSTARCASSTRATS